MGNSKKNPYRETAKFYESLFPDYFPTEKPKKKDDGKRKKDRT